MWQRKMIKTIRIYVILCNTQRGNNFESFSDCVKKKVAMFADWRMLVSLPENFIDF